MIRHYEEDSHNLPEGIANTVNLLVNEKEKFQGIIFNPDARDTLTYLLEVNTESEKINFRFDETNLPAELAPLFNYLREKSMNV